MTSLLSQVRAAFAPPGCRTAPEGVALRRRRRMEARAATPACERIVEVACGQCRGQAAPPRVRERAHVEEAAVAVVVASQGYPGTYAKGKVVTGLAATAGLPDVKVFHAGTKLENGLVVTDGGRVLGVTALGDTLLDAKRNAYDAASRVHFQGAFYRRDIGDKALVAEQGVKAASAS